MAGAGADPGSEVHGAVPGSAPGWSGSCSVAAATAWGTQLAAPLARFVLFVPGTAAGFGFLGF